MKSKQSFHNAFQVEKDSGNEQEAAVQDQKDDRTKIRPLADISNPHILGT